MGRKGKTQKHSAAEINAKHKAAKEAKGAAGGGNSGAERRKNVGNRISVKCQICMSLQPNMISMESHFDSKHSKINFNEEREKYRQLFIDEKNKL